MQQSIKIDQKPQVILGYPVDTVQWPGDLGQTQAAYGLLTKRHMAVLNHYACTLEIILWTMHTTADGQHEGTVLNI